MSLDFDIELLKTSVRTAQDIGSTPMLVKILQRRARAMIKQYGRDAVPDWVEALERGDAGEPAALIAWLMEHVEIEAEIDAKEAEHGSV